MPSDHTADFRLQILWNWFNIKFIIEKIYIISVILGISLQDTDINDGQQKYFGGG
jgi:hypothetical protein